MATRRTKQLHLVTARMKRRLDRMIRRGQSDRHIVAVISIAMLRAGLTVDLAGLIMGGVLAHLKSRRGDPSWADALRP